MNRKSTNSTEFILLMTLTLNEPTFFEDVASLRVVYVLFKLIGARELRSFKIEYHFIFIVFTYRIILSRLQTVIEIDQLTTA